MAYQLAWLAALPVGIALASSGILLGMEDGMSNRRASLGCLLLALLAFVLAPVLAYAQATNLECPVGKICTVNVRQSASPDVDQLCLRELARPDRAAPAPGIFMECKDTAPGATQTFTVGPLAANAPSILFAAVSRDIDFPGGARESDLSTQQAKVLAPIGAPTILELLQAAVQSLRDAADKLQAAADRLAPATATQ